MIFMFKINNSSQSETNKNTIIYIYIYTKPAYLTRFLVNLHIVSLLFFLLLSPYAYFNAQVSIAIDIATDRIFVR